MRSDFPKKQGGRLSVRFGVFVLLGAFWVGSGWWQFLYLSEFGFALGGMLAWMIFEGWE